MNRGKIKEAILNFEPVFEDRAKPKKPVSRWPNAGPSRTHLDFWTAILQENIEIP